MNHALTNVLLALAWGTLTGSFTIGNLLIGYLLGYFVLWLPRRADERHDYFRKIPILIGFVAFFLKELFLASLRVAHDIVTPTLYMKPAVLAVPLDLETDLEITILATLVSLTPGTLSLDVSEDRRFLFVHAMYVEDADETRMQIKEGFESRVMELMR